MFADIFIDWRLAPWYTRENELQGVAGMAYTTRMMTIKHAQGLNVLPAAALVKACRPFEADAALKFNGVEYNLKSVLGIISAGIRCGDVVEFITSGPQAVEAMAAVADVIETGRDD